MEAREFSHTYAEPSDETSETLFQKRRCCFCFPSSGGIGFNWWRRIRTREVEEGSVWAKGINAVLKLREWSELAAGPRWKTFIRRFNRSKSGKQGKFQYDPLSYALNFDEGHSGNNGEEDEYGLRNFSTRYASIPASAVGSMDLGKDGPNFV
ncbi:uncharacterized protein LOC107773125 [Nicotiana tabacum]|uniref:Uncharacterized protein LOC107773125 n=1 Tax=Nicotiana tabacum TaxID=4097 RepID=A0A1S3Y7T4_TOBAC|nr:uncharacterized protein LOC104114536 [Nicotiana tomentosiformis]XP_016448057.1 PREDICTED: uncharacterized protein LOC107773125 [Nicotiana tabacum]